MALSLQFLVCKNKCSVRNVCSQPQNSSKFHEYNVIMNLSYSLFDIVTTNCSFVIVDVQLLDNTLRLNYHSRYFFII